MENKILIIEDESDIQNILRYSFIKEKFKVRCASCGIDGIEICEIFNPDIVILDLMLPDISGFEVLKNLTKYNIPIIMLTARHDIVDKVLGLELGADDYITKPFDIREVKMRVKVALRRLDDKNALVNNKNIEKGLFIDIQKREVRKDGEAIKLSKKEFDIIWLLYSNKEIVFSREQLLNHVWGIDYYGDDRTIDVHIRRLREKLGEEKGQSIIETVFGVGYVMR